MNTKIATGIAALVLTLIPTSASAADYPAFGAYCTSSGSGFQAPRAGMYSYLWRDGYNVLGAGSVYLRKNQHWTGGTPSSAVRFAVVTSSSMTYAYITCS